MDEMLRQSIKVQIHSFLIKNMCSKEKNMVDNKNLFRYQRNLSRKYFGDISNGF